MNKLIIFDMNGVIFQPGFWEQVHEAYGTEKQGKILTEKYLTTDYAKLVEEVVNKLWKGKSAKPYLDVIKKQKYMKGAKATIKKLKKRGYITAIISGGPRHLGLRAKKEIGIDLIFTNDLIVKNKKITGEFKYPIAYQRKQVILRNLAEKYNIDFKDVAVVVHDDNDLRMAKTAGIAIAFNPSPGELLKYCRIIIRKKDLSEILKYLK
jgi:phosphoserine phosphatase